MTCLSVFVVSGSCCEVQSLWCVMSMVIVLVSSLATILAQWMASSVVLWSEGNARPILVHLADLTCPIEPNIISQVCGACEGG